MPNAESGITIDRYCVSIALRSGADVQKTKTFLFMSRATHGCLSRVGVVPPKVTITADDPRLRVGSPRRTRSSSPPSASATVPRAASSLKTRRAGSRLASRQGASLLPYPQATARTDRGVWRAFCAGELGGCALRGDKDRRGNFTVGH